MKCRRRDGLHNANEKKEISGNCPDDYCYWILLVGFVPVLIFLMAGKAV
jgi:hypothetical protein